MSSWVKNHHACNRCGSSDAASTNEDNWTTCFSCGERYPSGDTIERTYLKQEAVRTMEIGVGAHKLIRSIEQRTCERYGIRVSGEKIIFEYRDKNGMVCAQKVRAGSKDNQYTEGQWSDATLFGQHLFGEGGRYLTITEGEFDAASAYQMTGSKYPVVSVRNGAKAALSDCKKQYKWIDSFDNIIICFDSDQVGQDAAREVAALFAGKAKIVKHHPDYKDANDYLESSKAKEFTEAWWGASLYTPDGIVAGDTLWDLVSTPLENSEIGYPWNGMNKIMHGIRFGELVTFSSGSGMGKSQILREILYHILNETDSNIGCLFFEESIRKTGQSVMSLAATMRLHIPHVAEKATPEQLRSAYDQTLGQSRMFFYEHFGSTDIDNVVGQVRFMSKALDCKYVFLDHLSILVSAQNNGDERKALDEIMTRLRMLVEETGIALFCVSHLKRPDGKGHEEGGSTSLSQLRGSAAIAQLSDMVVGLEGNRQADDALERNQTHIRVLKNRFSGETGRCCVLQYDADTGRMFEVEDEEIVL